MGYDVDRFVDEVKEGLLCCICRDVLEEPLQAPCEHAFCSSCIQAWLVTESICPEDRRPLLLSDLRPVFRYMRNDLDRLHIHCKNRLAGCSHTCSLEFLRNHEDLCTFEVVTCPHRGCGVRLSRSEMSHHMQDCQGSNAGSRECKNGCGLLLMTLDDREHNCIEELRTSIEVLRSEMLCKLEDQRREMELRLDMQRGHMVQREAALQSHIDELKTEIGRISQKVKLLMDLELQRRNDIDKMQEERMELLDVLQNIQREQEQNTQRCHHCSRSMAASSSASGKITTL